MARLIDADQVGADFLRIAAEAAASGDVVKNQVFSMLAKIVNEAPTVEDAVQVIRCHQCESCTLLADWAGFHCAAWDTDFYAPHYDVTKYYCADGKRRAS